MEPEIQKFHDEFATKCSAASIQKWGRIPGCAERGERQVARLSTDDPQAENLFSPEGAKMSDSLTKLT
jgi:hypothetical protein